MIFFAALRRCRSNVLFAGLVLIKMYLFFAIVLDEGGLRGWKERGGPSAAP